MVFTSMHIRIQCTVGHVISFQVILVHQFRADYSFGSHTYGSQPGRSTVNGIVRLPEMFVSGE